MVKVITNGFVVGFTTKKKHGFPHMVWDQRVFHAAFAAVPRALASTLGEKFDAAMPHPASVHVAPCRFVCSHWLSKL